MQFTFTPSKNGHRLIQSWVSCLVQAWDKPGTSLGTSLGLCHPAASGKGITNAQAHQAEGLGPVGHRVALRMPRGPTYLQGLFIFLHVVSGRFPAFPSLSQHFRAFDSRRMRGWCNLMQ
jgi:hypothetical protein